MASTTVHVTVCLCAEAELVDRLATCIADHLAHPGPEGIVPAILAEDLVVRLRARGHLLVREDVEAL